MRKWRAESILDLYNLVLAVLLFVSPWFFAHRNGTAVIDLRASSAAIAIISLAAMFAVAYWEEWTNLAGRRLADRFTLGAGLHPYQRHAFQHRRRCCGGVSGHA